MSNAAVELETQLENITLRAESPVTLRGDGTFVSGNGNPVSDFEVLQALHELQQFVGRAKHLAKAIRGMIPS